MSDHGGGGGGGVDPVKDLFLFLGFLVLLFIVWVYMGGPQKAEQKKEGILINGPVQTGTTRGPSGQIQVTPVE